MTLSQDRDRKFCSLCGLRLVPYTGPRGLSWLQCPRWPKGGSHWWSKGTPIEHDSVAVGRSDFDLPYDPVTGRRVST